MTCIQFVFSSFCFSFFSFICFFQKIPFIDSFLTVLYNIFASFTVLTSNGVQPVSLFLRLFARHRPCTPWPSVGEQSRLLIPSIWDSDSLAFHLFLTNNRRIKKNQFKYQPHRMGMGWSEERQRTVGSSTGIAKYKNRQKTCLVKKLADHFTVSYCSC